MRVIHFRAKRSHFNAVPFDLLVEEEQYSSFCQYVKDNYPKIRCDDSTLSEELGQLIKKRIREFLNGHPEYTADDIRFSVDSIVKIK